MADGAQVVHNASGARLRSRQALWILAAFAEARTPREVAEEASTSSASAHQWIEAVDTIRALFARGFLVAAGEQLSGPQSPAGFASEQQHIAMLGDTTRTGAFLEAIRQSVRPSDVVLDIGSGTGILALAAARAGARRVYAVEQSVMAGVARRGAAEGGLADTVTVIHGSSTSLELPEKADLVVSEVIGDDLFGEGILRTMADAGRRLAHADARFIPSWLAPVIQPLKLDSDQLAGLFYTEEQVDAWTSRYGMSHEWLLREEITQTHTQILRRPRHLAEAVVDAPLEFPRVVFPGDVASYRASAPWPGSATANALALGFRAGLTADVQLSSVPGEASSDCHWSVVVWVPNPRLGPGLEAAGMIALSWLGATTALAFEQA